jgi:hypothetical protein
MVYFRTWRRFHGQPIDGFKDCPAAGKFHLGTFNQMAVLYLANPSDLAAFLGKFGKQLGRMQTYDFA